MRTKLKRVVLLVICVALLVPATSLAAGSFDPAEPSYQRQAAKKRSRYTDISERIRTLSTLIRRTRG